MRVTRLIASLLAAGQVRANVKAVFAHFMVGNTGSYSVADWQDDMTKAAAAHIDGFALNMAVGEATNGASLANAFTAANNLGSAFKLFFSFDYAGNGLWDKTQVISLINTYASNAAYYHRGSQPLVSTFEGPAASADWPAIKSATNCFFIPSWSSLGAAPAWALGTADGLFSWAAWPEGPRSMSTFTDHSYLDALGGSPYMMGVSPWFFTNMPGFRKNWLWRGDSLWFDRWVHVMSLQPEYVEIISWNDFGECHHIGPLRDNAYVAFDSAHGKAPFNYALGKTHDGWRTFLPFLIDMAKSNTTSFSQENVVAWYRENPSSACGTGGTTGNTASQLQQVYSPGELAQDMVFYAALLASSASVSVSIGGQSIAATWTTIPSGGIGLYRGSVPTGGLTGSVVITITRSGAQILQASGDAITSGCTSGIENWNANVITGTPRSISPVSPLSLASSVCTGGFGDPKYLNLCSFACGYGYCPAVCTCTSLGAAVTKPSAKNVNGCPAPGMDSTYLGLCSFSCNYGYCPSVCQIYPAGHVCTAPNPQAPPIPVCVAGMADGPYADLCSFSCYYGFCPPQICTCTKAGTASPTPPAQTDMVGGPAGGATDYGLCQWTCQHGNCPSSLCTCSGAGCSGQGPSLGQFSFPSQLAITMLVGDSIGSTCSRASQCTNQLDVFRSACDPGQQKLGFDRDGCTDPAFGKSICCSNEYVHKNCAWRGDGPICNGQCLPGEQQIMHSAWGGGVGDADRSSMTGEPKCLSGTKALCCEAEEYALYTKGCRWTDCWDTCSPSEVTLLHRTDTKLDKCPPGNPYDSLCCPKPSVLRDCVWRGSPYECLDAQCQSDEVAVALDVIGDATVIQCFFEQKKIGCCKLGAPPPPPTLGSVCGLDWCSAFPAECEIEGDDAAGAVNGNNRLTKRWGNERDYPSHPAGSFEFTSRDYFSRGAFARRMLAATGQIIYWEVSSSCDNTAISKLTTAFFTALPSFMDADHVIDLQVLARFADYCISGILSDTSLTNLPTIPASFFDGRFVSRSLPGGLARVTPTSPDIVVPMSRVFEAFGSTTNTGTFMLVDDVLNQIKGKLVQLEFPVSAATFRAHIMNALGGDALADAAWIMWLQKTIAVFNYLEHPDVHSVFIATIANIRAQFSLIDQQFGANPFFGLAAHWDEYIRNHFQAVTEYARMWLTDRIVEAMTLYERTHPADYAHKVYLLMLYLGQVNRLRSPL